MLFGSHSYRRYKRCFLANYSYRRYRNYSYRRHKRCFLVAILIVDISDAFWLIIVIVRYKRCFLVAIVIVDIGDAFGSQRYRDEF
jgi:hypothetical protein